MTMRILSTACLAFAGAVAASTAGAATIDFDGFTGPASTYTAMGVTFSASAGNVYGVPSPNGTNGLIGTVDFSTFSSFRADIAGGATSVGVELGDYNADSDEIYLEIYDSMNLLLGSTSATLPSSLVGFGTLTLSNPNISYALFGSRGPSLQGSSVFADNFTFDPAGGVPEPASWALMIGGFGAVGGALRRRRVRTTLTFA